MRQAHPEMFFKRNALKFKAETAYLEFIYTVGTMIGRHSIVTLPGCVGERNIAWHSLTEYLPGRIVTI